MTREELLRAVDADGSLVSFLLEPFPVEDYPPDAPDRIVFALNLIQKVIPEIIVAENWIETGELP